MTLSHVILSFFLACVACGQGYERDPFGPVEKKAAELVQCVNGHKTLMEVPIVYGHVGGLRSNPEIAAKAERGEIVFGGCIVNPREHWVTCKTCGLSYDDDHNAWRESFPANPYAAESNGNPSCTPETIRKVISKELQDIALDVAGEKPSFLFCARWRNAGGIVGEQVAVSSKAKTTEFQSKLERWLQSMGAPKNSAPDPWGPNARRWEWTKSGKSYDVSLNGSAEGGSWIYFNWHVEKHTAEEAGSSEKEPSK